MKFSYKKENWVYLFLFAMLILSFQIPLRPIATMAAIISQKKRDSRLFNETDFVNE